MRHTVRSLRHAIEGLTHALATERNLLRFTVVYIAFLLLGAWLGIAKSDWMALVIAGMTFVSVELLNTALERFVDAFDEHRRRANDAHDRHLGLKATKDVASAASLIGLLCVAITIILVFYPHVLPLLTVR